MNKLQEQSLQAKDVRYVTSILDEGFDANIANHVKTQAMLSKLLNRSNQTGAIMSPVSTSGLFPVRDFYNLFVIAGEKFDGGSFTVAKDRALVISIEPDVKKRFFNLRDDSIVESILKMPSLFMNENIDYMRSRPGQKALLGRVTDLEIEANVIRISFELSTTLFQQNVTDMSHSLGMLENPGSSELNNTHWTIKQIDLIKVLTESGLLAMPSI